MSSFLRTTSLLTRLALGGLALGAMALAPTAAWAQAAPVFDGQGLIELVPPTGLVGDGASAADLYILALGPSGTPITGLKGKPTATAGTTTELVDAGGGLYKFTYTPAKVDGTQSVTLSYKGKIGGKDALSRSWTVSVAPPKSRQLTVGTNPPQIVVGQDPTASVAINLAGGDRQNLTAVDLAVKPSSGTVDNLIQLGGGQFSALYTPQNVKYPHIALLTVVDKRDPTHTYGGIAVPMVGKADYPVTVAPNARVILKVAGREFGPIAADAMGRAMVPIIVPPGTQTATRVQITPDGKVTEDPLDLKIPETRRIALFPSASAIPADGRLQVPVRAMVVTPDGKPDPSAQVVFSTTAGVIGPAKHEGNGVYVAMFTPPFGNAATQATVAVNLADKPSLQADSLTLNLVPTRPTRVSLTSEPTQLGVGADGFKVFAKVIGPDGSGLGGRDLRFAANGARLKGDVKDLRNGDYQAQFSTTGNGPVDVSAVVSTASTGNPLAKVLLIPAQEKIAADGLSSAMVTIATVDEFGYPVPNQDVTLKLTSGDGTFPVVTKTNTDGIAQVYYTAGRKNGLVTLSAAVGELTAATAIVQAPASLPVPDLPVSGTRDLAGLVGEWQGSLAGVRLEREGGVTAAAAAPAVMVTPMGGGGAPAKLGLTSDPASVVAGGTVVLRVNVLDAGGRGVGGQQLDFLASAGTVGPVTDLGGGMYQAVLSVPAGTSGEVKVSAATRDGSISAFMRVPVGGAAEAWGGNPFGGTTAPDPFAGTATTTPQPTSATPPQPTTTTAPVLTSPTTTTTTTVVKQPATPGEHPWLRMRVGYQIGSYSYSQTRLSEHTVLFEEPIGLGATTQGFQADARLWVPGVPYVGFSAKTAIGRYTLAPQPLCEAVDQPCEDAGPVADVIKYFHVLAAGRYPFEVGSSQFSVGARAGWSFSDMVAYTLEEDEIVLRELPVHSLALGPEVGAEIGDNIMFQTYFLEHLKDASSPVSTQFGAEIGYAFNMAGSLQPYVSGAYDLTIRKAQVANSDLEPVGEVQDASHTGTISVGFQVK